MGFRDNSYKNEGYNVIESKLKDWLWRELLYPVFLDGNSIGWFRTRFRRYFIFSLRNIFIQFLMFTKIFVKVELFYKTITKITNSVVKSEKNLSITRLTKLGSYLLTVTLRINSCFLMLNTIGIIGSISIMGSFLRFRTYFAIPNSCFSITHIFKPNC